MKTYTLVFSTAVALVAAQAAQAAPSFFANATGIPTLKTTVTFSEVPLANGATLTNEYAAYGITFIGAYYDPQPGYFPTPSVGNFSFSQNMQSATIEFDFSKIQTGIAFQLVTNPGASIFAAYLGATLVATGTSFTNSAKPVPFYGFTGGSFDRVILTASRAALLLDNLQLSVAGGVPEPASWALMIAGFGLVGAAARRRSAKVVAA